MFIDIHVHAQRKQGAPRHGIKPWACMDEVLTRYDELDIERGVFQPLIGPEFYEPQSNQDILDMAEAEPDRVVPFFAIHPRAIANTHTTNFRPLIEYYLDQGCKGFGEAVFNMPFNNPLVENLLGQLEEYELPFCFHISDRVGRVYGLVDEMGLPLLEQALKKFPKLKFMGHSAAFWSEIGRLETPEDRAGYPSYCFQEEGVLPKLFRRYPNLHGDLSANSGFNALNRNIDYAVEFLTEFQDRLFFGTDICTPDTPVKLIGLLTDLRDEKRISKAVFEKISHKNARKLLRIRKKRKPGKSTTKGKKKTARKKSRGKGKGKSAS